MIAGINPVVETGFKPHGERLLHSEDSHELELDFEADLRAQDAWRESQLMQETGGLGSMAKGIMRPGGRHTIVCKHWLRDLCMKGDKCDFLHQYDLARMPECTQWSRMGRCIDQECDFRHDTERMECQKYKFGFCKLGSQCKMRHERHTRPYLPEVIPDWFLKELVPNIFEFVPKLPEETVRITNLDDQMFVGPTQGVNMPFADPSASWGSVQDSGPVIQDAWAVTEAPQWSAPAFRTTKTQPRDGRSADDTTKTQRDDYRRPSSRRAPVTDAHGTGSRPHSPSQRRREMARIDKGETKSAAPTEDRSQRGVDDRRVDNRREQRKGSPELDRTRRPEGRRDEGRRSPVYDRGARGDRRTERRSPSPQRDYGRRRADETVDRQPSTRGSSPSSRRTETRERRNEPRQAPQAPRRNRSRSRSTERRRDNRNRDHRR